MRAFNVQLSSFNDRLIEQINIARHSGCATGGADHRVSRITHPAIDLPLSYQMDTNSSSVATAVPPNDNGCKSSATTSTTIMTTAAVATVTTTYSKYRKRANGKWSSQKLQRPTSELGEPVAGDRDACVAQSDCTVSISGNHQSAVSATSSAVVTLKQPKIEATVVVSGTISDHVPHFKSIYPEMTSSSFM